MTNPPPRPPPQGGEGAVVFPPHSSGGGGVEASPPSRSPLSALRHRDFAIYWGGTLVSGIGAQFTMVAVAWQVYELTSSAFQLGLLGLIRGVPTVVVLLFGGLLADAVDRRRLLIVTQVAHLGVTVGLLALTAADAATPLVLYVATALLGIGSSLEQPSRAAVVPNLVPPSDLTNALALSTTQRSAGMIIGPSVAGVVLGFAGPAPCYGVEVVSRLAMLGALAAVRLRQASLGGRRAFSFDAFREGVAFLWTHPLILALTVLDFAQGFLVNPRALLPVYARDILEVGPEGLGILYAASSVGSIVMATAMSLSPPVRRGGLLVLIGVGIFSLATVGFSYSRVFWFSALMLALEGVGNTVSVVLRGTILQLATPDELRGRVSSVNSVFTLGGPQIGHFRAGVAAELMGTELSVLTGSLAVLGLTAAIGIWAPAVRRFEIERSPAPSRPGIGVG